MEFYGFLIIFHLVLMSKLFIFLGVVKVVRVEAFDKVKLCFNENSATPDKSWLCLLAWYPLLCSKSYYSDQVGLYRTFSFLVFKYIIRE